MPLRPIKKKPYIFPKGIELPHCHALDLENVYHTPGQAAAIRFFDSSSEEDYQAAREITSGRHVRKWMDDTSKLDWGEYRDWAGVHSDSQFLFAVLDARGELENLERVQGFIYLYAQRAERYRVSRMVKLGFLKPATGIRHSLEVSFALRPPKPGVHTGSGLISSALRQSSLQVHLLLDSKEKPEIILFGFVDQKNEAARRTLEAAGYEYRGLMKYDPDVKEETCLYILNWKLLDQKIREKLVKS